MGKLIKILFSVVFTILLVIVVAAVALPFIIDPNDYKPQLSQLVTKYTGRQFNLEGDLNLSVFPWLGVEVGHATLANASGFSDQNFAEIGEVNVKVKLLPLLSKKVEVSEVVVKGLQLHLAKDQNGVTNWDDLMKASEQATDETASGSEDTTIAETETAPEGDADGGAAGSMPIKLEDIKVGGISIEEASVVWNDQQSGQNISVNDFNLGVEQIQFDTPIPFEMSLDLKSPSNELQEIVNLTGELTVNQALDHFKVDKINLNNTTRSPAVPTGEMDTKLEAAVDVDMKQERLSLTGVKLTAADVLVIGADLIGTKILTEPVITGPITVADFDPRALMERLQLEVPETSDAATLKRASMNFNLKATKTSAAISDLVIHLDDTTVNGTAQVKDFTTQAAVFDFDVDAINVDRYLPPKDESAAATTTSSSTSSQQSSQAPAPAKTNQPATSSSGDKEIALPVEALRKLNLDGTVDIGRLQASGLVMNGVRLKIKGKDGVINSDQLIESFYQGKLNSAVNLDVRGKQPVFNIKENLAGVQLEPLLQALKGEAQLTGRSDVDVVLKASGNTVNSLKASLNGNINANVADGVLNGFNLVKYVKEAKARYEGESFDSTGLEDKTPFNELKYVAAINQGVVNTQQMVATAEGLDVKGTGQANLVTETLNQKITTTITGSLAESTGVKIKELESLKGVPLVMSVTGTFSDPKPTLDLTAMLEAKKDQIIEEKKAKVEEKINEKTEKLQEKLNKKVPGAGDLLKDLPFFK